MIYRYVVFYIYKWHLRVVWRIDVKIYIRLFKTCKKIFVLGDYNQNVLYKVFNALNSEDLNFFK